MKVRSMKQCACVWLLATIISLIAVPAAALAGPPTKPWPSDPCPSGTVILEQGNGITACVPVTPESNG